MHLQRGISASVNMANTSKDHDAIAFAKTLDNTPWCDDYEKMISGMLYDPMLHPMATHKR